MQDTHKRFSMAVDTSSPANNSKPPLKIYRRDLVERRYIDAKFGDNVIMSPFWDAFDEERHNRDMEKYGRIIRANH